MDARILEYLRATIVGTMKRFLSVQYGAGTAAIFAASLTLWLNVGGLKVAVQTVARNFAFGYLKSVAIKMLGPEEKVMILEFCCTTAKLFFRRCRVNGVVPFRFEARRFFRVANEQILEARTVAGTARKREGSAFEASIDALGTGIANHVHTKHFGFHDAFAVAC